MKTTKRVSTILALCFVLIARSLAQHAPDSDEKLASDFWGWRARTGQYTNDDVTRMERPDGVMREWSAASIERQRRDLANFEERWKKLVDRSAPVWKQVDHRLLGSGLARVRWELDVLDRWQRDPNFYIEQTLTPVGEALTVPGPYSAEQSREILARLNNIPAILDQAEQNLSSPPGPYAQMAIESLAGIRPKLEIMATTLAPFTTVPAATWHASAEAAATSLEQYRVWLEKILPSLSGQAAIGREKYVWFLRNVALMPYEPEQLVLWAEQEWHRAVAFEGLEQSRNRSKPPLAMAATTEEFVARNEKAELESELCQHGCSISRCDLCHRILPRLAISLRLMILPRPRDSIKMGYAMWLRLRPLQDTSGLPMRKTRAFRLCMRERLDTTDSSPRRGRILTQYAGTTTTPAPMKGSAFTRKK
jgi:hypothetical protein